MRRLKKLGNTVVKQAKQNLAHAGIIKDPNRHEKSAAEAAALDQAKQKESQALAEKRALEEKITAEEIKKNGNSNIIKSILAPQEGEPKTYAGIIKPRIKSADAQVESLDQKDRPAAPKFSPDQTQGQVYHSWDSPYLAYSEYKNIPLEDDSATFFIRQYFHVDEASDAQAREICIYVYGTGFTITHTEIEAVIASHLANALNMPVFAIEHRRNVKWPIPLNDVCRAIEKLHKDFRQPKINLIGFSTGGLLATLAMLAMQKKGISVQRLTLFAPILDLAGEFSYLDSKEKYTEYSACLPQTMRNNHEQFVALQNKAAADQYRKMNPNFLPDVVHSCFSAENIEKLMELRRYSPAWIAPSTIREDKMFPEITIIAGDNDVFRMDCQIFHEKILEAGKNSRLLILNNEDHRMLWQVLYSIYLVQKPLDNVEAKEHDLRKITDQVIELDQTLRAKCHQLRIEHKAKELKRSDVAELKHLKSLCQTLCSLLPERGVQTFQFEQVKVNNAIKKFKDTLESLKKQGDRNYPFLIKRQTMNAFQVQFSGIENSTQEPDAIIHVVELAKLFNLAILSLEIKSDQYKIEHNWQKWTLSVTAESEILNKIIELLLDSGAQYVSSLAKSREILFSVKSTNSLLQLIYDSKESVNCLIQ